MSDDLNMMVFRRSFFHATFVIIVACFLLGPVALCGIQHVCEVDLPSWLTSKSARYLTGASDEDELKLDVSIASFQSGRFQAVLQAEMESFIPVKADALLITATTQRTAISFSNLLFDWKCFPTYFGSTRCFIPSVDAIAHLSEGNEYSGIEAFGSGISSLAAEYPDIDFCVVFPDTPEYSTSNPTHNLMAKRGDVKDIAAILENATRDDANVWVSLVVYDSPTEYFREFYTSDHHWNGWGTIRAYNKVADLMGLTPVEEIERDESLDGFVMNGTGSRFGLMLLDEKADEPLYDIDDLVLDDSGTATVLATDGRQILDDELPASQFSFYDNWYSVANHNNGKSYVIRNKSKSDGSVALIVGDSFRSSLQWLIAKNYQIIVVINDLYYESEGDASLCDLIDEYDCGDVFFVGDLTNYQTLTLRLPNYFDV